MVISKTLFSFLLLAVFSLALPMHADGREYTHALAVGSSWEKGSNTVNKTSISALKPGSRLGTCSGRPKLYRKAWHTLTAIERKAYIDAEICMIKLPARLATVNPAVRNLFDDMQAVHQIQSDHIHSSGHFLPFHRYHVWAHETLLREACGYTGAQPFWEEQRDAGKFALSSIFSPKTGFGSATGTGENSCVTDGPFAGMMLSVGPGYSNEPHCLSRKVNETASLMSEKVHADACLQLPTFDKAWPCIENLPHRGGHNGVMGEMSNAVSSPGDPLFYLHHSYIDKLWWQWQRQDLDSRLKQIAGMTTSRKPTTGWVLATLDDTLTLHSLVRDVKISELMDIESELLCYDYVL